MDNKRKNRILNLIENSEGDSDLWDKSIKAINTGATLIGNPKLRRWVVGGTTAATLAKTMRDWYVDRRSGDSYAIRIYETDILYDRVHQWVTSSVDESELRSIVASASPSQGYGDSALDSLNDDDDQDIIDPLFGVLGHTKSVNASNKKVPAIEVMYDGSRTQIIEIGGYEVEVRIGNSAPAGEGSDKARAKSSDYILIDCPSLDAKNAVLERLDKEARAITERRPRIFGAAQWGNFRQISSVPKRPISSVVLKEGQAERILGDIKEFLSREKDYGLLGMPFRRGILLEGQPGTGKSSVATALAHELGADVFIISLSAIQTDNDLMELVTDIRARSILLLEDIDVASAVRDRSDESQGVSMSGVLNALDGIATPHGLITVLTTNHVNVIDPAMLRPGRVDLREEIGPIDNYQLRGLCKTFLGFVPEDLPNVDMDDKIVAASVVECFKRNLDSKENAARDLVSMITITKSKTILEESHA